MRANGSVLNPAGLGPGSHVCWPYDDPAQFAHTASTYIADGLRLGERVLAIVDASVRRLLLGLERPAPRADRFGPSLQILTLAEVYDDTNQRSPEQQVEVYDAMTHQARADGYAGLRVLADVTGLLADPVRLPEVLDWEHHADEYIAGAAYMSAMCGYRSDLLDPDVVQELACLHPLVRTPLRENSFGLFFDDRTVTLAGTVETFSADRLRRALSRSHVHLRVQPAASGLTLDLSGLDFIDGKGLSVLADWARGLQSNSVALQLVGVSKTVRTVWAILGYDQELAAVTVVGR